MQKKIQLHSAQKKHTHHKVHSILLLLIFFFIYNIVINGHKCIDPKNEKRKKNKQINVELFIHGKSKLTFEFELCSQSNLKKKTISM